MESKKVNVVTMGCPKNIVDSEILLKQLQSAGYVITHDDYETSSDTVIINTCGFINDAREESIDMILKFADAKKRGLINRLYVIGCLSQKYPDELKKEIPEVDRFFGVNCFKPLLSELGGRIKEDLLIDRILTGPAHYAYLKISDGCNRSCAFCSIPCIRGKHISKSIETILREASVLEKKGVKELILVAQDLNYYGIDIYKKRMLGTLIKKIASENSFEWIRLQYLYPNGLSESLIDNIKEINKICKYIDIPLQHITDRMLKKMKRGYSRSHVEKLITRIKEIMPDAAIRTTLITGHPGETREDFIALRDFVKEFQFDRLGVFKYSHEEGTYAGINYSDDISDEEKEARASEIMEIQQKISLKKNMLKVGSTFKVLIDRSEGGYFIGRTEYDSPDVDQEVLIANKYDLHPGLFYNVKITSAAEFDLYGIPYEMWTSNSGN
ncbi:MAG: 30S ribosomal protein S12 methylthiotransferase RimO [Bacteroidales bacterium]|nr:30S ribosomal protein S12 methylthiotransferase RimO [Bacteroidales bacterium]